MKNTAIELLINKLRNNGFLGFYCNPEQQEEKRELAIKIINEAKAMEKQQIIDAVDGFPIEHRNMLGEEYYEKTFNK